MTAPLEAGVDHVRGPANAPVIVEYGDYECPYSRQAYRAIQHVETQRGGALRFAFRHFPLTEIHPHALAASRAAEAAALQGRFWEMHDVLYHRQKALEDDDLRRYAAEVGLDAERFDRDRTGEAVFDRIERDFRAGSSPVRYTAPPPCSSTMSSISGAMTRKHCWRCWHAEGEKLALSATTASRWIRPLHDRGRAKPRCHGLEEQLSEQCSGDERYKRDRRDAAAGCRQDQRHRS